ncbi:CDP-diacylglycerol--glycerol-3-phosphate 3-phosphatidyltransferase [Clydaea vesicula]|uniref:CDP-diacylglycerol--glycerol-3-phosphate 3-phosphatidyltransferase n=1 Tax=Clydaea vesicula TaxID=447962 RepID=A0AAD5U901_9FUNG|nr:CDP-diacylglycerol--glycerol-3-phosphate 3-phosphatidyltransferase [Clydaea vesicula]
MVYFQISAGDIEILNYPSEFYEFLKSKARIAKKKIVLSSLYIGTSEKEKQLINAIEENLKTNVNLKVIILLDNLRGLRVEKISKLNSLSLLENLIRNYPKQVEVNLFHTNNLKGLLKKLIPQRLNEVFGLMHMKIYCFDDLTMLSGANLSKDYFQNRQDRYISFNNKNLTDFFLNLVQTVSSFSNRVELIKSGHLQHDQSTNHEILNNNSGFYLKSNTLPLTEIKKSLLTRILLPFYFDRLTEFEKTEFLKEDEKNNDPQKLILDENINLNDIFFKNLNTYTLKLILKKFQETNKSLKQIETDTLLFPTLQMGEFNLRHDENFLSEILKYHCRVDIGTGENQGQQLKLNDFNELNIDSNSHCINNLCNRKFFISSAYLNFSDSFLKNLFTLNLKNNLKLDNQVFILTASPKSNGFFKSKGVSQFLPAAYTYLLQIFLKKLENFNQKHQLTNVKEGNNFLDIFEYEKENWTFHCKGKK